MKKQQLSLYGTIFFLCFFLIVGFFSSRGEDYAKESEQKVTIDSAKHEKHTKDKEENNSANTVFFDKINDLLVASVKEFEGTVGISYLDLETGEQRSVNGQHEFYTASTIKVPLTMLVADTVASGQKKWTDLIPYNAEEDYEEGTGIIAYNIQPEYPLKTLQEYAITYSDNIAKNMLYDTLGGDAKAKREMYQRYLHKTPSIEEPQFSSEDALVILQKLYTEKATKPDYQAIYDSMKQSVFHERMETPTTQGKVAHKIGSYDEFIHDMGILETPHPFALAIFTKGPDNAKSAAFIASVTDKLWQLQVSEYPNQ
ncbi:serine hydrolase [Enterococcus faecalis]